MERLTEIGGLPLDPHQGCDIKQTDHADGRVDQKPRPIGCRLIQTGLKKIIHEIRRLAQIRGHITDTRAHRRRDNRTIDHRNRAQNNRIDTFVNRVHSAINGFQRIICAAACCTIAHGRAACQNGKKTCAKHSSCSPLLRCKGLHSRHLPKSYESHHEDNRLLLPVGQPKVRNNIF